jgi:hypothetical protein
VLGPLDDALIAALALRRVLRSVDRTVVERYWRGSPGVLEKLLKVAGATREPDRSPEPGA